MNKFILILCLYLITLNAEVVAQPVLSANDKLCSKSMLDESRLEGRLQGALDFNHYFDTLDVEVSLRDGIVTLDGVVSTEVEKLFAEKIALKITGTQKLINKIEIQEHMIARHNTDLEQYVSDAALLTKIKVRFLSSRILYGTQLQVEVKDSIVYLNGEVQNEEISNRAYRTAASVYGVRGVRNQIKVSKLPQEEISTEGALAVPLEEYESRLSDAWISNKVRSLLQYSTDYSGCDVSVVTKSGNVKLGGIVRNQQQKDLLYNEVSDLLGVRQISGALQIAKDN